MNGEGQVISQLFFMYHFPQVFFPVSLFISPTSNVFLQISYTETASGEITITSGSGYYEDGKEDLRKCRQAAEQAQREAEKAVEEYMKSISDLDKNFKNQEEELEKTMKDLDAQVGGSGGVGRVGDGNERLLMVLAFIFSALWKQVEFL